jgi:hypothetical protein
MAAGKRMQSFARLGTKFMKYKPYIIPVFGKFIISADPSFTT